MGVWSVDILCGDDALEVRARGVCALCSVAMRLSRLGPADLHLLRRRLTLPVCSFTALQAHARRGRPAAGPRSLTAKTEIGALAHR